MRQTAKVLLLLTLLLPISAWAGEARTYRSHRPMRPLPTASTRPMGTGPSYFVDGAKGDDASDGSRAHPWRTIAHAVGRVRPGDTLYLREGTYYEHINVTASGTAEGPITIRSYPAELAVIDGGIREFFEEPAEAWEPSPGGARGEFVSTRAYPDLAEAAGLRRDVSVLGNFGDSMVPLHGYRFLVDFRCDNEYWNIGNKLNSEQGIYCGPGIWYNPETKRIHARLSHTGLNVLGEANYRGESDPRKLRLIVAGPVVPLLIEGSQHLRFQDLVVRGSAHHTIHVSDSEHIEFDGLTIYGGAPAVYVRCSGHLRLYRCAVRGLSAPWSSRASHKYRGISPYLFIAAGDLPQSHDFELAYCEFTDNHDGLIVGTLKRLRLHHNLVDNFDDDGVYLTLGRPVLPEELHIYQNLLSRTHTMFSFAEFEGGPGNEVGPGACICRNVLDLRGRTYSNPPTGAAADATTSLADWSRVGRPASDHGGPTWEPMFVYHNTVITSGPAFRNYYGAGWGGHTKRTRRRVFNNIFVQLEGNPGLSFASADDDVQVDANLLWGPKDGPTHQRDFFAAFRASPTFAASKKQYPPGWGVKDLFADPKLMRLAADWLSPLDVRLQPHSPAVNAGIALPSDWPDPLREMDEGPPDIGALPLGAKRFAVGPRAATD